MPKPKTNKQIINQVLDSGPMFQIFVVSAIQSYCDKCIEAGPDACGNAVLDGKLWVALANDIKKFLDAAYENNRAKK